MYPCISSSRHSDCLSDAGGEGDAETLPVVTAVSASGGDEEEEEEEASCEEDVEEAAVLMDGIGCKRDGRLDGDIAADDFIAALVPFDTEPDVTCRAPMRGMVMMKRMPVCLPKHFQPRAESGSERRVAVSVIVTGNERNQVAPRRYES